MQCALGNNGKYIPQNAFLEIVLPVQRECPAYGEFFPEGHRHFLFPSMLFSSVPALFALHQSFCFPRLFRFPVSVLLFEQASTEEQEVARQLAAVKALAEASQKDSIQKYALLQEKMKSCSVTEETYIAKYHTEEQKLSQMREKLENFQKEKIRVQEQLLQIKKKLKSKRMEQGEFALLEKEVQTLETETTEENKSFGAVRKELEQMKTAWKEKENVCVLLEKIHHKLDILSELEGLFRGKRFVEYISRYYLEHIAREADTGLKEMTGNTYEMCIRDSPKRHLSVFRNSSLQGNSQFVQSPVPQQWKGLINQSIPSKAVSLYGSKVHLPKPLQ